MAYYYLCNRQHDPRSDHMGPPRATRAEAEAEADAEKHNTEDYPGHEAYVGGSGAEAGSDDAAPAPADDSGGSAEAAQE